MDPTFFITMMMVSWRKIDQIVVIQIDMMIETMKGEFQLSTPVYINNFGRV